MRQLTQKIIEKCFDDIKITNKEDASIFGYCVKLAMGAIQNEDGSISYSGFFEHKNNAQWEAERYIDRAINEV